MLKVKIKELRKMFGSFQMEIPLLEFNPQEAILLLGNNGAGKTTLLSLLLDLILPDSGCVEFDGQNIANSDSWRTGVGAYISQDFLIPYLSPREYFELIADFRTVSSSDLNALLEKYSTFLDSNTLNNKLIRELSTGNKQKVGILSTIIGNPSLIVLDEPHAGLDPSAQHQFHEIMQGYQEATKATIIISSHNLNYINEFGDQIILIENGRIIENRAKSQETISIMYEYFGIKENSH